MTSAQFAPAREITLENSTTLIAFDARSGAVTRLEDKAAHWLIERRPELGVSFRLFAPRPDRNYNPVLGEKQRAFEIAKISGQAVRIQWRDLASENGGILPMTLTSVVALTNDVAVFKATLENDSQLPVDTIDYPCFGDVNPPTRHTTLEIRTMRKQNARDLQATEIYPHFGNEHGYWGVFYPLKTREANESEFCLVQSPDEGLYIGLPGPGAPYRIQYTFELRPGVVNSVDNLVPEADTISGIPVHMEFRACHFIWLKPHSRMELAPVMVRAYQGGWHAGVDLYKQSNSAGH